MSKKSIDEDYFIWKGTNIWSTHLDPIHQLIYYIISDNLCYVKCAVRTQFKIQVISIKIFLNWID